jgi:hypothetical protein
MSNKLSDAILESQLNQQEGESMSAEEVAKHFGEEPQSDAEIPTFKSAEDAENWEKAQQESSDIYRISARVKNHVSFTGGSLTPVGEILCNSFIHVMKAFYDFADTLSDIDRERLRELIRKQEGMPANVIAASKSHVQVKKR